MDFVALDVETANENHAICEIGAVLVKDNEIVDEFQSLIDPVVPFNPANIKIHNIASETVKGAPTFPQLLNILPDWIFQYPIVAHNASTEYYALLKAFALYHKEMPSLSYFCTRQTAELFPWKGSGKPKSFRLEVVASALKIPLENHHRALQDARCAAQCALYFLSHGSLLASYTPPPESIASCLYDKKEWKDWDHFQKPKGNQFFPDPRFMWIPPETDVAEHFLRRNNWPELRDYNTNHYRIPDCNFDQGEIDFPGKSFAFSGVFPPYIEDVLWIEVSMRGGIPMKHITKNTDYLIIGAAKLEKVANQNGKSKSVLDAEKWIGEGSPLKLLHGKKFLELCGR